VAYDPVYKLLTPFFVRRVSHNVHTTITVLPGYDVYVALNQDKRMRTVSKYTPGDLSYKRAGICVNVHTSKTTKIHVVL
jgi:hypothetical protein